MTSRGSPVRVHDEVAEALRVGAPVVALETAVLTTGLPRRTALAAWAASLPGWRSDTPIHLETMRLLERTIRTAGAVPAIVAVLEGELCIGLDAPMLERLASDANAGKAATRDLAAVMASGGSAGTTVSATLAACARARPRPIRVFATGGIGGVHRGWTQRPDVSADLVQLSRTACCVVCAGAKSILDPVATLETLETLGVPVIGFRTDCWPQFFATPDETLRVSRINEISSVAELCSVRWDTLDDPGGVVLAVPVPGELTLERSDLERLIGDAESRAVSAGVQGAARTPWLLTALAEATDGRSLQANVELLRSNAAAAASLACSLAR